MYSFTHKVVYLFEGCEVIVKSCSIVIRKKLNIFFIFGCYTQICIVVGVAIFFVVSHWCRFIALKYSFNEKSYIMPLSAVQTPKWFIGYQITRSSKIKKVSGLKTSKLKSLWEFFQQTF